MDRAQKEEVVSGFRQTLEDVGVIVVTHYSGLTVAQSMDLRSRMREAGANFKVMKNRLARLAIDGTEWEGIGDMLTGPTALAWSEDPVSAPKIVAEFAKEHDSLVIVGGAMDGAVLDEDAVKQLASLPSLDELRGKLIGLVQAPATKIAGVMQAPAGQLARVVGAYGSSQEAA